MTALLRRGMANLRLAWRLLVMFLHMFVGVGLCVAALPRDPSVVRTPRQMRIIQWWTRRAARILGLRVRTQGAPPDSVVCLIANHPSWLDILAIGGLHPVRFLSKAEVADWPIFGYLAERGGTLFIRRGMGAKMAAQHIKTRLAAGENVVLFPEGSSAHADPAVRRFHPRLLGAAIEAGTPVLPAAIAYRNNGGFINEVLQGDTSFVAHACAIMRQPRTTAIVHFGEPLRMDDKDLLAKTAHNWVRETTHSIYEA